MNERLKALRKELGLNQTAFADKIGLQQATYSTYETGQVELRESVLKTICYTYQVNELWLKTGEGEMFIDNRVLERLHEITDQLNDANLDYLTALAKSMLERQREQDDPNLEGT